MPATRVDVELRVCPPGDGSLNAIGLFEGFAAFLEFFGRAESVFS
jgi:hypothetical protein